MMSQEEKFSSVSSLMDLLHVCLTIWKTLPCKISHCSFPPHTWLQQRATAAFPGFFMPLKAFAISFLCWQHLGFQNLSSQHHLEKGFFRFRCHRLIQSGQVWYWIPQQPTAPQISLSSQLIKLSHTHKYMSNSPSQTQHLPQNVTLWTMGEKFIFLLFRRFHAKETLPLPHITPAPVLPAQLTAPWEHKQF